jgi:hypothetical protein
LCFATGNKETIGLYVSYDMCVRARKMRKTTKARMTNMHLVVARTYRSENVKMLASYWNLLGMKPFYNRNENDNDENADKNLAIAYIRHSFTSLA